MVSLIDLLSSTYAPVQSLMLEYLDVRDVNRLTVAAKGFCQLQPLLKSTSYDVDRFLSHFFIQPKEFRATMGRCGAIIAGDSVRKWLLRSNEAPTELIIYVDCEHERELDDAIFCHGVVQDTQSRTYMVGSKNIHLHAELSSAVVQMLNASSDTASLSFFTWNKAYVLYPYTTFIKAECYLLEDISDHVALRLASIAKDGLKTKNVSWAAGHTVLEEGVFLQPLAREQGSEYKEMTRARRVGDRHTWSIDLDIEDMEIPSVPDAVVESTTFLLRVPWERYGVWKIPYYTFGSYTCLRQPVLKHCYNIMADPYEDPSSCSAYHNNLATALWQRLNELTLIELAKIPPAKRPSQYANMMTDVSCANNIRDEFTLPASWTFYDDEVLAYLDKLWALQESIDERDEAVRQAMFQTQGQGKARNSFFRIF